MDTAVGLVTLFAVSMRHGVRFIPGDHPPCRGPPTYRSPDGTQL
jgi:hypothetical protein